MHSKHNNNSGFRQVYILILAAVKSYFIWVFPCYPLLHCISETNTVFIAPLLLLKAPQNISNIYSFIFKHDQEPFFRIRSTFTPDVWLWIVVCYSLNWYKLTVLFTKQIGVVKKCWIMFATFNSEVKSAGNSQITLKNQLTLLQVGTEAPRRR